MALSAKQIKAWVKSGQEAKFYNTAAWRSVRKKIMEASHWECQACLREGRLRAAQAVHHIAHLKARPDLAFAPSNLEALCHECHDKAHGRISHDTNRPKPLSPERY